MGTKLQLDNAGAKAATDILTELLGCRESLPVAANSRPPYPTDAFARYAHVEVQGGRGPTFKGLEHLMTITIANLRDGMALSEAKRWVRRAERIIDACAATMQVPDAVPVRSITTAIRREQRTNHAFDMDELRVIERADCPETVRAAIRTCRAQRRATEETEVALEHHLALLTTTGSPRVYGARRNDNGHRPAGTMTVTTPPVRAAIAETQDTRVPPADATPYEVALDFWRRTGVRS